MFELMGKGILCKLHKTLQALTWLGLGSESIIRIDFSDKGRLLEGGDKSRPTLERLT